MEIGRIIKDLRNRAGFKQKEFAKACSISPSYLSQIESNARIPHPNTLKEICKVLEVPGQILYLLSIDKDDIPKGKQEAFEMLFPPLKAFLIQLFPITKESFGYEQ